MKTQKTQTKYETDGPSILMRNQPRLSEHAVDQKFNEMRLEFLPYIKEFVAEHELFRSKNEVGITFAHKGVSSIIAIIDTPTAKWVLKIPRSETYSAGEGQFLQVWEDAGVTVPHVFETGKLHGSSYVLMEFIDAPTLDSQYNEEELLNKKIYVEMGRILRLMHSAKISGYGCVVNGKPEFETVEGWLGSKDMKTRFDYMRAHNLFEGLEDVLHQSLGVIKQNAKLEASTYCHDDYGPYNMFATDPITVFDANPKFNSGYYDLGRMQFIDIAHGDVGEVPRQMLQGYFDKDECKSDVLRAYTFIAFCMKCPYWHQTNRKKELETAKKYFIRSGS